MIWKYINKKGGVVLCLWHGDSAILGLQTNSNKNDSEEHSITFWACAVTYRPYLWSMSDGSQQAGKPLLLLAFLVMGLECVSSGEITDSAWF